MRFVTPQARNYVFKERSKQPAPFNDTTDFVTLEELKTLEKKSRRSVMSDSESDNDPLDDGRSYDDGTILTNDETFLSSFDDDQNDVDEDCDEVTESNLRSDMDEDGEDGVEDGVEEEDGVEAGEESVTKDPVKDVKRKPRKKKTVLFKMVDEDLDDSW